MPWCEDCAKFWNPNSLPVDGRCPSCGIQLAEPLGLPEGEDIRAPWHFKLLVAATVVYLGWRTLQLAGIVD
ncbi:MAG: hypothetical protein H0W25_00965 [Acidimicrobiia bacterium]|nr:hypothetical protein [Acidimicrobiia bacterium]